MSKERRNKEIVECFKKWKPTIQRLSYKWQNRVCSPDDLTQAAALRIVQSAELYDNNKDTTFATYAYRLLKRAISSTSRDNQYPITMPSGSWHLPEAQKEISIRNADNTIYSLDNVVATGSFEEKIEIEELIAHHDIRGVGRMHFIEGMTYNEIAKSVGFSKSEVGRCIVKIRDRLKKDMLN